MTILDSFVLAELHREVYVAMLDSWVPHGKRAEYAGRAGISPQYLSNLRALDPPAGRHEARQRQPSAKAARRLANALPAPPEVRDRFFNHLDLAHKHRIDGENQQRRYIDEHRVMELLADLQAGHGQAAFGKDLRQTERAYRALSRASDQALKRLSPDLYPAAFTQICLYAHDAHCVLDRADEALYYAKLGRRVLESASHHEPGFTAEQVDDQLINAIRGEAVAFHNLGLERRVGMNCDQAQVTAAYRNAGQFWRPLVGRDRLNALVNTPRFSRLDARALADNMMATCERAGDSFSLYLVQESWLRCLVQLEKWTDAEKVLQSEWDLLAQLPQSGPLHRALLLKTAADLAWRQGDRTGWQGHIRAFVHLARAAGLRHQLRLVEERYGAVLQTFLKAEEVTQ